MAPERIRTVAVSGSHGFIGSHLVRSLLAEGYAVIPLGPPAHPLENGKLLAEFFHEVRPDALIHLAGRGVPGRDLNEFDQQYSSNILPCLALARNVPASVQLSLFFGSCEEYGNGHSPFRETQTPICFSPYGWGKISAHLGTMMIAKQRNLNLCWLRPFLTFGPGQETDQLVPSLIKGCLRNEEIALTFGEQTRDFLYIHDLCAMIKNLLQYPEKLKLETLNLGSGSARSVKSVALLIRQIIGRGKLNFGALPYRQDEAMSFYASIEKYKRLFGEPKLTPLEKALHATINGYVHAGNGVEISTIDSLRI